MSTSPVASTDNSGLLDAYVKQSQEASAAAKKLMADNVASGVNASSSSKLAGSFNTFLKILTTQLQHQDPTAPMDTTQFTQQLVQFSGVEQQINTNQLLQKLVDASSSSGVKALLGFVNQYVEVSANNRLLMQGGQAEFSYTLPSPAFKTTITVADATGNKVATFAGPTASGVNNIIWNGESSSGGQLKDGLYSLSIVSADNAGNPLAVGNMQLIGKVTGVQTADSAGNDLILGPNLAVKDSDVGAVFSPGSIPQATPPADQPTS